MQIDENNPSEVAEYVQKLSGFRFNDFRSITAKYSNTATCGHHVKAGDAIGWARKGRTSQTQCAQCWARWRAENAEADAIESGYMPQVW